MSKTSASLSIRAKHLYLSTWHNIRISPYGKNISIYLYVARHLHPIPFKIFAGRLKDNFTWERKNISLETKRNLYFGAPFYLVIKASLLGDKYIFTWGHKKIITERSKYYLTRKYKKFIAWRQEKISTRRSNTSVLINQKHRTNTSISGGPNTSWLQMLLQLKYSKHVGF
ncbi:hypothetical protein BDB01DRAFT_374742 [Pilobolus umbonatus]|nr:hypothetical protein BDB01DRAFT_374742 [Pilobolus umbonatus]